MRESVFEKVFVCVFEIVYERERERERERVCVCVVTGWKGTRDKESSNQKPRRVDFINPCSRVWVVMPDGLVAVFSNVSRCG